MASPYRINSVWVNGLRSGQRAAYVYFFNRYYYGLKIYTEMNEDLAMESFETALLHIDLYDEKKSSFITWIYAIARNKLNRQYRQNRHFQVVFVEDLLECYNEEDTGGDEREEWIKPTADSTDLYSNFLEQTTLHAEEFSEIGQAVKMLSREQKVILNTYLKRTQTKLSTSVLKVVFKQLRLNLFQIREREERLIRNRLSA
jgi:RNA polymerase sigma factor (sigma-70 family)